VFIVHKTTSELESHAVVDLLFAGAENTEKINLNVNLSGGEEYFESSLPLYIY
jgi:hypothetical protein